MRDSALRLWIRLARAYRAIEAVAARDAARHGLTLAEFGMLEALYHLGPLPLGQVQRKLLVSSGGATYLADGLEARGLIRRRPSPEDRRVRIVELTDGGRDLIARTFPEHASCLREALGGLEEGEREAAAALLKRLGRHAGRLDGEQVPSGDGSKRD